MATNKAADLVRQLLAFSRKQDLNPSVENLNERVKNMENMLRRLVQEDISISLYLSSVNSLVYIDPSQFEMVLMNLTVNASDSIRKGRGGRIASSTKSIELEYSLFSPLSMLQVSVSSH